MPSPDIVGLALPATQSGSPRLAARSGVDVAWGDVIVAIMCPVGGRVMNRAWGNPAIDGMFDPLDDFALKDAEVAYKDVIARLCPHIRVYAVRATRSRSALSQVDARTLNISVQFSLVVDQTTVVERTVLVDRSAIIRTLGTLRRM